MPRVYATSATVFSVFLIVDQWPVGLDKWQAAIDEWQPAVSTLLSICIILPLFELNVNASRFQ